MVERHRWTFEEDYVCCYEYLRYVFENEEDESMEGLVEIISKRLPGISKDFIRMRIRYVKQLALEAGLEDSLDFIPLEHYLKPLKRAFEKAMQDYEEARERGHESINPPEKAAFAWRLIGATVCHKAFGEGEIISKNETFISVKFPTKTATFAYPSAFHRFLSFKNSKMQDAVLRLLGAQDEGRIRHDEIEDTQEYARIKPLLERMIVDEIGVITHLGYCHRYWMAKKRILKDKFGIEWKSPAELNPNVLFD